MNRPIASVEIPIFSQEDFEVVQTVLRNIQDRNGLTNSGFEGGGDSPFTSPANPKPDIREGNSGESSSSAPEKPATKKRTKKTTTKAEGIDISEVRELIHSLLKKGPDSKPIVLGILKEFAPETGRLSDVQDLDGLAKKLESV